jgi:hypothetical protein
LAPRDHVRHDQADGIDTHDQGVRCRHVQREGIDVRWPAYRLRDGGADRQRGCDVLRDRVHRREHKLVWAAIHRRRLQATPRLHSQGIRSRGQQRQPVARDGGRCDRGFEVYGFCWLVVPINCSTVDTASSVGGRRAAQRQSCRRIEGKVKHVDVAVDLERARNHVPARRDDVG